MSGLLRNFCNTLITSIRGNKIYRYQGIGKNKNKTSPNAVEKYMWRQHFRVTDSRCYFPRANELKRIRTHGWDARMATEGGRKVLMARILKGRHVLSH